MRSVCSSPMTDQLVSARSSLSENHHLADFWPGPYDFLLIRKLAPDNLYVIQKLKVGAIVSALLEITLTFLRLNNF